MFLSLDIIRDIYTPVIVTMLGDISDARMSAPHITSRRLPSLAQTHRTQGRAWYPLFSTIFKYLTWIPETVKYGISNFTVIGGLRSASASSADVQIHRVRG